MKNYLMLAVLSFCALPAFGSAHLASRSVRALTYPEAKLVSYPVRHPKKSAKAATKAVSNTATFLF